MWTWPTTLPQQPVLRSYALSMIQDAVVRTEMSYGTDKLRPRGSLTHAKVSFRLPPLTATQVQVLEDFYRDVIEDVGIFEWIEHYLGRGADAITATYRFLGGPPKIVALSDILWEASIVLEMLPSGSLLGVDYLRRNDGTAVIRNDGTLILIGPAFG